MRTVIVFESMFGNTEHFAHEIRDAISGLGEETTTIDVRHVHPEDVTGCDLLVVGAPTHGFSLSRQSTRNDAVCQGADATRAAFGVREWLTTLEKTFPPRSDRPAVAVFDTRAWKVRHLPGSAARRTARTLSARGFELVDRPTSFYVTDLKGPPLAGEVERANAWATGVARAASDLSGARRRGRST